MHKFTESAALRCLGSWTWTPGRSKRLL